MPTTATSIAFIDFDSIGQTHQPYNLSMLQVLAIAFPHARLHLLALDSHCHALEPGLKAAGLGIEFHPHNLPLHHLSRWAAFQAASGLYRQAETLCALADRRILVAPAATPSTIAALMWWQRRARFDLAQLLFHGTLAQLFGWRSHNPLLRVADFTSVMSMKPPPAMRYTFLEEALRERAVAARPHLAAASDALPHPLTAGELRDARPSGPGEQLHLGFVGLASSARGYHSFLRLAEAGATQNQLRFSAYGHRLAPDAPYIMERERELLDRWPGDAPLDRPAYIDNVRALDYILLPFAPGDYDWISSGVVLDAIAQLTPLLATRTPQLAQLFQSHGPMGVLFDTVDEIERWLRNPPVEALRRDFPVHVAALKRAQAERLPQSLAGRYTEIMARAKGRPASAASRAAANQSLKSIV